MAELNAGWFRPGNRELPYADTVVDSDSNPWSWLREASGTTASEAKLLQIARRSMLSLWSIPSPYTDEGLASSGSGKELCDLIVIFGDDVILFSDKDCAFPQHPDINVAWSRWYRRAIEKSAKQLVGAEGSLRRADTQMFTDHRCTQKLPLDLPDPARMRVHMIAVAHGAVSAAESYWIVHGGKPGSSGSLMLNTKLDGSGHEQAPFQIGWPLGRSKFIHVLDDLTLELLMNELDTVRDLTNYLAEKERLFRKQGCEFIIPGEEELLAAYITNVDQAGTHKFPSFPIDSTVVMREGHWNSFRRSRQYKAREAMSSLSYLWDDLIEYQASHVIYGSTDEIFVGREEHRKLNSNERILRVMASEDRRIRCHLGETVRHGRDVSSHQQRFFRTFVQSDRERLYCFVFLPYFPDQQSHSDYRQYRQYLLHLYCEGALLKFTKAKEIIGIALEPYDTELVSVDFMYFDIYDNQISPDDRIHLEEALRGENLWNSANVRLHAIDKASHPGKTTLLGRLLKLRR